MLLASEFTVGALANAEPGSLMLPRLTDEEPFLIGQGDNGVAAVFVGANHTFHCFDCSDDDNRRGLLVPNIHIEVDIKSVFDPQSSNAPPGTAVRVDNRLILLATHQRT